MCVIGWLSGLAAPRRPTGGTGTASRGVGRALFFFFKKKTIDDRQKKEKEKREKMSRGKEGPDRTSRLWDSVGLLFYCFTGFYRVYWVLLGFTGFYWVLLGFTGFELGITKFHQVLHSLSGFYWILLGFKYLY